MWRKRRVGRESFLQIKMQVNHVYGQVQINLAVEKQKKKRNKAMAIQNEFVIFPMMSLA
jgi:hypothetical protein